MKQTTSLKKQILWLRICMVIILLVAASFFMFSFTVHKMTDDFLKQLGITKPSADDKISNCMLGGSFDTYGIKNVKNIPVAARAALTKDAWAYTKLYMSSAAFIKTYNEMREYNKPKPNTIQTPEEMQKETIAQYKKSVEEMERIVKTADASMKPAFEKLVVDAKKQLKEAEDPNNKSYVSYKKNYPELVQVNKQSYDQQIAKWETEYPSNQLLFVKKRLQQFLDETTDIDFTAATVDKNGKKVFVNTQYERKSNRWKMAYRAGKDVVETSRMFVQQWLSEIK